MDVKGAKIQFVSAMWVGIIEKWFLTVFKDDSNDDNLDACLNKTSKTLGECILDCEDDISCESNCVSAFKDEHSQCPVARFVEPIRIF